MKLLSLLALAALALPTEASTDPTILRKLMSDSRFLSMVNPCTMGGSTRSSPAEWLRTAFHDMADHDAAQGTGGVDASIQFELNDPANNGGTMDSVMTQLSFYLHEGITLADLVGLGANLAIRSCSGPAVPYMYGRETASGAAPEGTVPEPQHATETHVAQFTRMGFSQQEMIAAVACGHTIGGVHKAQNPQITNETFRHFDTTRSYFDNKVATSYVADDRFNPLAQPVDEDNLSTSSDTRVFSLDKNVTLQAMADSNDHFLSTCGAVFSKMLNSVPSGVNLQGPLEPYKISGSFWPTIRNGVYVLPSNTGSARLYGQKGLWKSFEIGYTSRDGTEQTDGLVVAKPVREMMDGLVEVRDFSTNSVGIPLSTGLGAVLIKVEMNDGSTLTDEGQEVIKVDDTVLMDIGNEYTCKYTEGESGTGFNMSVHVLGPFNPADKVEFMLRNSVAHTTYLPAVYRAPLGDNYNTYNLFIPDYNAYELTSKAGGFGARVTRANGEVHMDISDGRYYRISTTRACIAGAKIPGPGVEPSGVVARRSRMPRQSGKACPPTHVMCGDRCINLLINLEHCGTCDNDCTTLTDGYVQCIKGRCVLGEDLP